MPTFAKDYNEYFMDFEIIEMKKLTGVKARVYSIILDGEENSLIEQFFNENAKYTKDLNKVINKITVMANNTGCLKSHFKEGEGALADGVVALRGTGCLRLYGIYFHNSVILFGSGGYKPPKVAAYEDYPPLNAKAQQIRTIAKEIYRMIKEKELIVHEDGILEVF